jgi:hypothetical protein
MAIRPILLLLLAAAVTAPVGAAQTTATAAASAAKPLVFEVASIRPSKTQQYITASASLLMERARSAYRFRT